MSHSTALLAAVLLAMFGLHAFARETRLLEAHEPWAVDGHFARGGIHPISDGTALARSEAIGPSPLLWGSFVGDDAHTGTLRSPAFEAPSLLALFVTGYPGAPGNSLFLERERDGARHSLNTSSPGQSWREAHFWLPGGFRGESVRLVVVNGATQAQSWLGVSTPRAITAAAWMGHWIDETSPVPSAALALFCIAPPLLFSARKSLAQTTRQALARSASGAGTIARRGAAPVLGLLCLLHFSVLYRYAVDIPYLDEWRHLTAGLAREFSGPWIWSPLGDQRIVFTKLHTWLLYSTGGWNLRTQILQNFVLYAAALGAGFAFLRKNAPQLDAPILLAFFAFPLSHIAQENHQWGIASHYHFGLLFLVLCAHFAFRSRENFACALAATGFGVAAIVSSAAGAATVTGLVSVFAIYTLLGRTRDSGNIRFVLLALILVPVGLAIAAGSGGTAAGSLGSTPAKAAFWRYFLNLVSGGFGVSSDSALLGGFWFAVATVPWVALLARQIAATAGAVGTRARLAPESWAILALSIALFAGLFATSLAQAGLGAEQAKSSRHAELATLLLPLSAVAWSALLAARPVARRRLLGCLFALAAFASLDDWSTEPYRLQRFARESGVKCARDYYQRDGAGFCPTIASGPIPRELDRARELDLHFYRRIRSGAVD